MTSHDYDNSESELVQPDVNHGHQDDIVIAVLGCTGTGKSSFIKLLTGDDSVHVGNSLESETSDVQIIDFLDRTSGRNVIIVDTPGFDDSRAGVTDTDILKKITDYLLTVYDKDRKLNGLIYLQRISDPRFGGQSGRNLRMFRNLCGTKAYQNVVVLTTFWDRVDSQLGAEREEQLKTTFFEDLAQGGARFMRHDRNIDSARQVLQLVVTLVPTNIQIQEEIRQEGKTLEDTAAGSVRREEVDQIIAKQKEEVSGLKAQLEAIQESNKTARKELEAVRDKLQKELARWQTERAELRKGLDLAKEAQERLEAIVSKGKENYEKWRQDQERAWKSRFESIRRPQGQPDQEKQAPQDEVERESYSVAPSPKVSDPVDQPPDLSTAAGRMKYSMKTGEEKAGLPGTITAAGLSLAGEFNAKAVKVLRLANESEVDALHKSVVEKTAAAVQANDKKFLGSKALGAGRTLTRELTKNWAEAGAAVVFNKGKK